MGSKVEVNLKEAFVEAEHLRQAVEQARSENTDATLSELYGLHSEEISSDISALSPNFKCIRKLTGHTGRVYDACWSQSENDLIASVSQDGRLLVWDPVSGYKTHIIKPVSEWLMTCTISCNGSFVACGGLDNACSVFNLTGQNLEEETPVHRTLEGHQGYISSCRFMSNNNGMIFTSSGDQSCGLWDVESNRRVATFSSHTSDVVCISVGSANPEIFISGSCDSTVKLWDTRQDHRKAVSTYFMGRAESSDVNAVHLLKDGNSFVAGYELGSTTALFDIRSKHRLQVYVPPKDPEDTLDVGGVTAIAASHSGRLIFVAYSSAECLVWDSLTAEVVGRLDRHAAQVSCLGVSYDGSAVCTGSWDATIKVWGLSQESDES